MGAAATRRWAESSIAAASQALEADGARRLRNESFFSAPQLKRDSLGGSLRSTIALARSSNMRTTVSRIFALTAISSLALSVPNVIVSAQTPAERPQFPPPKPEVQPAAVESNLKTFDVLDFDVFSNQKWDRLQESHAQDIIVTWPDGHETRGIAKHIEDLKALFVYAPDITIKVHPIRFGSGSWTAVTGVMTGTFTRA